MSYPKMFISDLRDEKIQNMLKLHYNLRMHHRFISAMVLSIFLLAGCNVATAIPTPGETSAPTLTASPGVEIAIATPIEQLIFNQPPDDLQAQVHFPLLGLTFIPAGLAGADGVTIQTFADGSQTVETTFQSADTASADLRRVIFSQSNRLLDAADWFLLLAPGDPELRRATAVRGVPGFFYRNGAGEPALFWQEGNLSYDLQLADAGWPADGSDDLLLWMGESLQSGDSAAYIYQHRAPTTWLSYTSAAYQFSFAVPREWQQNGDADFSGANGFVRLEVYRGYGARIDQACELEANLYPDRYGEDPTLRSIRQQWGVDDYQNDPCLILPGVDAPTNAPAALLFSDPTKPGQLAFLRLSLDPAHAEMIAYSLDLPHAATATAATPLSPQPSGNATEIPLEITRLDPLIAENHLITAIRSDISIETVPALVTKSALARRADLRQMPSSQVERPTSAASSGRSVTLEEPGDSQGHSYAVVKVDGVEVYRYSLLQEPGVSQAYGVWNWAGRWVLEVNGTLVVEGELYNQAAGFQEIFDFHLIQGKPFFFFVSDGKTGIFYDGKIWPAQYDTVFHSGCCSAAVANPGGNDTMVWFYAQSQGWWEYVELGIFDSTSP